MYSTPKKRPKPGFRSAASPSSSHSSSMEPPEKLFPTKEEFLRLVAVLAIASSVAFACNFITRRFSASTKPFCDGNIDPMDSLSEFCEPCPRHGECSQGKLECARGYRKHGNICVEDSDINERTKKLSKWVENQLCEACAQALCDGFGTIWVKEDDIWNDLDRHHQTGISSEDPTYMYTKKMALETIGNVMEMRTDSHRKKELKCPDLLVEHYKPVSCRMHQWISKHAIVITPVCVMVVGFILVLHKVHRRMYLSTRGEELYHQVCDVLEESALTAKNSNCEPWVVASRLRDHLLLPKERKDPMIWKKVEELVKEDSRIDLYPKLVKGEAKVVWEWQVEGSLSSARLRRKAEASKLKSAEGIESNSEQQHHALKPEPKIPMF